jgi:membrane associated rhomboid family serine protease
MSAKHATSVSIATGRNHLSSNLFFLYIFGKLVEEEGGIVGVWSSYLITGIGANIVSYLLLPHSSRGAAVASCGASGAVFGLFAISVLLKVRNILSRSFLT